MKILITHELFPPDVVGGGEMLTFRVAKSLVERGYSVEVLTSGNPKLKEYKGIKTVRIPINRYLMNLGIVTIVKRGKDVDIIHTSTGNMCFPSWVAAKILNKPICCYVHHIFGPSMKELAGNLLGRLLQTVEKFFITRDYSAVIFQNQLSKKIGLDIGVEEKRTHIVQPGIDYKKFQMKQIKKEPFVLFVGNLRMDRAMVKIKGLEYLLEAAKLLSDVKFVIVGEGSYLNELKKTSSSNVIFTGSLFGKSLIELYNKALIFCLPSLTEGFGLVLLEAMASGCTIVSTVDIGQEGVFIKPKSTNDIVQAIKYFINNPKKAKTVGRKNRKLVRKFTWKRYIDELTKIYDLITAKS